MFNISSIYNNENRRLPDYKLLSAAQEEGWEIGTYDRFDTSDISIDDIFLSLNHNQPVFEKYGSRVKYQNRILVAFEPFMKQNFKRKNEILYGRILTWNTSIADNKKYFHFHVPISLVSIPWVPLEDRRFLVNISINKSTRDPRELYSERIKTCRLAERLFPDDFDFFGIGWNQPLSLPEKLNIIKYTYFRSYRGSVEDKYEVLRNYKFCLCYENKRDAPGLISEKIFDCFQCGVIPIYWGAPNVTDFIPEETMIWRERFSSNEDMLKYVRGISVDETKDKIEAISMFLKSDSMNKFLDDNYVKLIIDTIKSIQHES
jgi:hypothetical protein